MPLNHLGLAALRGLTGIGFAPSSQHVSTVVLQLVWVLWITNFSWIQMLGLSIYVAIGPFLPYLLLPHGETYRAQVAKELKENPLARPTSVSAFVVLGTLLTAWLMLYGNAIHRAPICVGIVMTGVLFVNRLYHAVLYSTMTADEGPSYLSRIAKIPLNVYLKFVQKIAKGEVRTDEQIAAQIRANYFILRTIRCVAAYIRGKQGKRRVAVFALTKYILNLTILGAIAILLWALAIQLSRSPQATSLAVALLASASHVIPGIPAPDGINVLASVQAGISVTAWAIFVLYAGPVASMYPAMQERLLKRVAADADELRTSRMIMYRLNSGVKEALAKSQLLNVKTNEPLTSETTSDEE